MKLVIASLVLPAASVAGHLGRCHIYGGLQPATACGYVTTKEETDPAHPGYQKCGLTPKTACISTMDGITWGDARCGECYKVTIHMADDPDEAHCEGGVCKGYDRSVYIKTVDGSYSDAEFEMSQIAWEQLCPNLCHSNPHENCVMDYRECKYGLYEDRDYFHADQQNFKATASCYASSHPVSYEKVDCNSDTPLVQDEPVYPPGRTTIAPGSGAPAPSPTTTTTKAAAPAPAPTTTQPAAPAPAPSTTKPAGGNPPPATGGGCYASTQWWDVDCKSSNHCNLFSQYTSEEACIMGNEPNAAWVADAAACLAKLTGHACDVNTK